MDLPDGRLVRYRYDGLGRRIEKDVAGSIRRFVYDQEDLVSVYDSTGCWQATVTHGPGIDQPLAFVRDDSGDCTPSDAVGFLEQVRTLQTDGLGSITSLVSETSGFFRGLNLKERYTYDSFGTPTITGPGPDGQMDTADDVVLPESAFGNIYFFTGREYDPESGFYYSRRRYYDWRTGRFINPDPLGRLSAENLYVYVKNNPVNFTDPFGEQPVGGCLTCGGASLGAGIGLPPLPGVDIPLPDPSTGKKDETVCPVESEDDQEEGKEVVCHLVDQSEDICQYQCSDGGFVNLNRKRLGEVCPPVIIHRR